MERLRRLQGGLIARGWDALLVSRPEDVRYLSGARGGMVRLVVTPDDVLLLAHYVDLEESHLQAPYLPIRRTLTVSSIPEIAEHLKKRGVRTLAVDVEGMTHGHYQRLAQQVREDGVELAPDDGIMRKMRWLKDEQKLARIRRATEINDLAYERIFPRLVPGVTERQIALEIQRAMWEAGAESIRFLAAQFGEHSALPHYYPTDRPLRRGDFVLLDWVPVFEGYWSDVTRTVVAGEAGEQQRAVYEVVKRAQAAGLAAAVPGATGHQADAAARRVIEDAGYGDRFGHSPGRGINEGPNLDQGSADVLEPGMVVTIEPGIYISGWGGVRIEDTVVITAEGARPLSRTSKELMVLC